MARNNGLTWEGLISFPFSSRLSKPRENGVTMVMDKGLGLHETSELLNTAGNYLDFIKLAFGTTALYSKELLNAKIDLIKSRGVDVYPGGTFLEIAILQGKTEEYLVKVQELGFTAIEVSDGTIRLSPETRENVIMAAARMGFIVLSEVGKKNPKENLSPTAMVETVRSDLDAGSHYVIIEARESGKGIGIFNDRGDIKTEYFAELQASMPAISKLIWEAPLKNQQQELILNFGPNVNLGNISPGEVLSLESLRVGLRGDTLRAAMEQSRMGVTVEC